MLGEGAVMIRILLFLFLMTLAGPVFAGAWLREQNTGFVAAAITGFRTEDGSYEYKSSLYAEWGLRPGLTIGLDAEEHQHLYGHALIFARTPVADLGRKGRFAAEFGVGAHHRQKSAWALYKATVSYGNGFESGWGNGWIAIDAALEYRTHDALFRKLDLTAGLSSQRWINPLLQLESTYTPGRPVYWSARPSVMIRRKGGSTTWVVGAERNAFQSNVGIKFALWRDF